VKFYTIWLIWHCCNIQVWVIFSVCFVKTNKKLCYRKEHSASVMLSWCTLWQADELRQQVSNAAAVLFALVCTLVPNFSWKVIHYSSIWPLTPSHILWIVCIEYLTPFTTDKFISFVESVVYLQPLLDNRSQKLANSAK